MSVTLEIHSITLKLVIKSAVRAWYCIKIVWDSSQWELRSEKWLRSIIEIKWLAA